MNILYITHAGFDTPGPNNQMAEVMFNDFLNRGHKVNIIQSHTKGINPDIPDSLKSNADFHADTIVRRKLNKSHFIKRYISDVVYYFRTIRYWLGKRNADLIYVQSGPTVVFLIILLKIFKWRTPIVYSIYDVFPGHAFDIGVIKSKFLYDILKFIQRPCYKIPRAITVLSDDMKEIVVKEGADLDRIFVIPAWFDVTTAKEVPAEENRFIKKYGIDTSKFYVQFAGTIGYVFNYKTVIEVAKRLRNEPSIVFQMIGDGTTKEQFIAEKSQEHLDNIQFYPLQPIDIVPDVYSACSIALIPLMKGCIGNGVPSKVPILMACRRAIISAAESDSHYSRMFKEHNMGISVDVNDYDGMADAIRWMKDNPEEVSQMVANAYRYGKENYSSILSLEKLDKVLTAL